MCTAGVAPMKALKDQLPNTEVLGVTILTSLNSVDVGEMFCCSVEDSVIRLAGIAKRAGIDGLISSPKEAEKLRAEFGDFFSINTPAIRPSWAIIPGDDQNPERIMTPAKAIKAGADRIVVGRPILQAKEPLEAVYRTLEEIWMVVGS
jgi:orotidine-5'-phosphate decarboxylase